MSLGEIIFSVVVLSTLLSSIIGIYMDLQDVKRYNASIEQYKRRTDVEIADLKKHIQKLQNGLESHSGASGG